MYNFNGCRTHIDNVVDQKEKKQSAGHGGIDSRHIKNNFIPDVIWSVIVTIFFRGYSFFNHFAWFNIIASTHVR